MSELTDVKEQIERFSGPAATPEFQDSLGGVSAAVMRHLAHELRQPLSTIESIAYYLDLILPPEAVNARQQVEKLRHLVEQSNWIVSNALDCAQAAPFAPALTDLHDLVSHAISLCDEPAPQVAIEGPLPLVVVDRAQGEHLLSNLLALFRVLGAAGPMVFRACLADAGEVVMECSSLAAACSQQQVEALLEPFSPGLPAGVGLGMASIRRVVAAHGGWMRARKDGSRLSIEISLPA